MNRTTDIPYRSGYAERKSHQESLEEKYGISGNPKAQKLYELAWEYGHPDGWNEIESYYSDMVELII